LNRDRVSLDDNYAAMSISQIVADVLSIDTQFWGDPWGYVGWNNQP